jgi:hypothetical protein
MNMEERLSYVSRKALNNTKRLTNIYNLIRKNINKLYGIIRINDYIICHGGINPSFLEKNKHLFDNNKEFIEHYNNHVRNFLIDVNYQHKFLITHKNSPFWDRTNGLNNLGLDDNQCKKIFEDNLLNIKIKSDKLKIIVAHCPQVINNPKMGINLANCSSYKNRIIRVDVAMSRAFDMYINDESINILINQVEELLNNNLINLDFILKFNTNREEFDSVQIVKITNNNGTIIKGTTSLKYFYIDVFKNNYLLMLMYLFQDILSNYLHTKSINTSELINNNINKLVELKKIIINKLFDGLNYFVKNN